MSDALREVFASFDFEFDNAKLKEADKGVDSLSEDVRGLIESSSKLRGLFDKRNLGDGAGLEELSNHIGGIVAALTGGAVAQGVARLADQLDTFDDLAAQTGLLTDQLQLLGYAAKVNGSSQEEMFAALSRLQGAMGRTVKEAGPLSDILKKLGVDTANPRQLSEVLPEILAGFGNLKTEAEQSQAAMALFGRSGVRLLPILRQGEEGLSKLNAEFEAFGGPVSAETIAKAGEFKDMVVRLDTAFFKLKGELASAVFPQLAKTVEMAAHGVAKLGEWAKNTTLADTATVAFAASLAGPLWNALQPFIKGGLKFGAIYLAVDELVGFLQGNDSIIGRILDGWFGGGTADVVRDWVNDAIGEFGRLTRSAEDTFAVIDDENATTWQMMSAAVVGFFRDAVHGFPLLINGAERAFHRVELELNRAVLAMQNTWNAFISGLALPDSIKAALQIDTTGTLDAVQRSENNLAAALERNDAARAEQVGGTQSTLGQGLITGAPRQGRTVSRFSDTDPLPRAPGSIALSARPDAPAVTLLPGPVRPDLAPSFSMVQTAPINIYLPAGTPAKQAEAIGRAAQQGIRNANREARQALVPRK